MAVETNETRLATRYESIRRREYELITKLLEILPKIDTLSEDRVAQVRDALFHADHPFLMVFVGPFSSGKSSLINALLGEDLLAIGPVPTTDRINILRYGDEAQKMDSGGEVDTVFYPSPLLKKVSFVDTPGLESIFQKHEETTRRFLHRSDVVVMVMLSTQAMTGRNVEYLRQLREFGKKVIVIINQVDLIDDNDAETVRQYVLDQGREVLGTKPEVWLVSAKEGLEARQRPVPSTNGISKTAVDLEQGRLDVTTEEAAPEEAAPPSTPLSARDDVSESDKWRASGMYKFEEYIDEQLDDVQRMRQKLQTPLQIIQNVHKVALDAVRANQSVLDQYQGIADNVQEQLNAYKREQDKIVRELNEDIQEKFADSAQRGSSAIQDIFQLSHAFGSVTRGFSDLVGLSRLFGRRQSQARLAFERHKVYEPIAQLPDISDRMGPRLEGKDLQDIDDLVKYAQKEVNALPTTIRGKVIGDIQSPTQYDRTVLQGLRDNLEQIEEQARTVETEKIENNMRNALFILAVWELLMIVSVVLLILGGAVNFSEPLSVASLVVLIALAALGLLVLPLVGRILAVGHTNRMLKLQTQYIETMTKAADKQIEYGMRLRRDVVAPLTRLVEAQTQIQTEQLNKLQQINQDMVEIETELTKMGKRNVLGI
ncbi:MAG: hypothetical protein OHK0046_03270 [Anaerolineae bacterium]